MPKHTPIPLPIPRRRQDEASLRLVMFVSITELCHLYPCPCPSQFVEQNCITK